MTTNGKSTHYDAMWNMPASAAHVPAPVRASNMEAEIMAEGVDYSREPQNVAVAYQPALTSSPVSRAAAPAASNGAASYAAQAAPSAAASYANTAQPVPSAATSYAAKASPSAATSYAQAAPGYDEGSAAMDVNTAAMVHMPEGDYQPAPVESEPEVGPWDDLEHYDVVPSNGYGPPRPQLMAPQPVNGQVPIYKKPWFWAAVGGVAVAGGVGYYWWKKSKEK